MSDRKLYYYMPPEFVLENLEKGRLKVSRYTEVNDPHELRPFDLGDEDFREVYDQVFPEISKTVGMICLSKVWNSTIMWSHYAAKHTGVCLEFLVGHPMSDITYISDKKFLGNTADELSGNITNGTFEKIMCVKHIDWEYEQEVRINVPLHPQKTIVEGNLSFLPFSEKLRLTGVIAGARCDISLNELEAITRQYETPVNVCQAQPAFSSFEMTWQRDRTLW